MIDVQLLYLELQLTKSWLLVSSSGQAPKTLGPAFPIMQLNVLHWTPCCYLNAYFCQTTHLQFVMLTFRSQAQASLWVISSNAKLPLRATDNIVQLFLQAVWYSMWRVNWTSCVSSLLNVVETWSGATLGAPQVRPKLFCLTWSKIHGLKNVG